MKYFTELVPLIGNGKIVSGFPAVARIPEKERSKCFTSRNVPKNNFPYQVSNKKGHRFLGSQNWLEFQVEKPVETKMLSSVVIWWPPLQHRNNLYISRELYGTFPP